MSDEDLTPRQRAAATKRARSRRQIIEAAVELYGTQMKGDYTLENIASAAGVGAATIANHFPTKYDVLRAAYRYHVRPIVEPNEIIAGEKGFEWRDIHTAATMLARYVIQIAEASDEYHALTVAMVRAYFDTPPERREHLYDSSGKWDHEQLGGPIATGMAAIIACPPFIDALTGGSGAHASTALYHSNELLLSVYHSPLGDATGSTALTICRQLLPVVLPNFVPGDVERAIRSALAALRQR